MKISYFDNHFLEKYLLFIYLFLKLNEKRDVGKSIYIPFVDCNRSFASFLECPGIIVQIINSTMRLTQFKGARIAILNRSLRGKQKWMDDTSQGARLCHRLGGCQRAVGTCQSLQSSGRSLFHSRDTKELMPM